MPETLLQEELWTKLEGERCRVRELEEKYKALEEKYRLLNSKYTKLVQSVTGYVYTVETREDGTVATVHGSGCEAITGYDCREYDANPDLWRLMIHEEDRQWVFRCIERIYQGEHHLPFEHRIYHKNGSVRWIRNTPVQSVRTRPEASSDDAAGISYYGLITDITERKLAEDRLNESYHMVCSIVDSINAPVYLKEPGGRYVLVNDAFCKLFGKSREELLGKTDLELFGQPAGQMRSADDQKILSVHEDRTYIETLNVEGEDKTFLTHKTLYKDLSGGDKGIIGISQDISAIMKAQEKELLLLQELRSIFENLPVGIAYLDKSFKILKVNHYLTILTGMREEELLGKHCSDVLGEPSLQSTPSAKEESHGSRRYPLCIDSKRPTVFERALGDKYVRVTVIPETNETGEVLRFLEMMEDITHHKKAEERIIRHYELQSALNTILHISLQPVSFKEQMQLILKTILSLKNLSIVSRGCLYLANEEDRTLSVVAHTFVERQYELCKKIPIGKCICGLAASSGEVVFTSTVDERHDITYEGIGSHGHYSFPIKNNERIIGVLTVYVAHGHKRDYDEEDSLQTIVNTLSGIIMRRQAEEILKEKEEHLRSVVQTANTAIISIDTESTIVFWNNSATTIFGYTPQEAIGKPLTLIMPERFRNGHMDGIAHHLSTNESQVLGKTVELVGRRKDGTEFPVELSIARWNARGGVFFTGIIKDITERKQTTTELKESVGKLRRFTGAIIQAMTAAVEVRDPYTAGHQRRVADLSRTIATQMGFQKEFIEGIRVAASIHDLGKIYVPSEILTRPGVIKPSEFNLIKDHSQIGYDILKGIDFPYPVAQIILQHHEKIDGSGYPAGLKGEEILMEARIICVADVVEAMANHRPYRPALGIDAALAEVSGNRGVLYDADVVDACIEVFNQGFRFST